MYIYFGLSIAFLFATLSCTFINKNIKSDLVSLLTEEEIKTYQEIINFRIKIYYQGLLLGIILSILYLQSNKNKNLFIAITITFVINYFYYILYPKPLYMIQVLDTKEENEAWLNIYKEYQYKYHFAFLFGLVFSYFLYKSLFK